AGVPDGAAVDLSLVKLPADALKFPCPPRHGEQFSLTKLRSPQDVSNRFRAVATKLGFELRLHDLRGTHETLFLDAGVPVRPSCCGPTQSARAKPTDRRRALSGQFLRACWAYSRTAGEQIR